MHNRANTPQAKFNPSTGQGELQRIKRINPSPILFGNSSDVTKY